MSERKPISQQLPLVLNPPVTSPSPATTWLADASGYYRTNRSVSADEIIRFSADLLAARFQREHRFTSAAEARQFFCARLATSPREVFACAFLDNRHGLIAFEELSYGTIDSASVYPREVVRRALEHNAAALIFGHNHPSGDPSPSQADERITQRLKEALALVEIRVLDHIVVGGAESVSFADRGLL